jgi:hypothetical protein
LGFGFRERPVEGEALGPGEEVDREHHDREPSGVDREGPGWEVAQAGVFRGADAVFDPGVGAVAGVEEGELSGPGVGGAWHTWSRGISSSGVTHTAAHS